VPDTLPAETVEALANLLAEFVEDKKAELLTEKKAGKVKTLKVRDLFARELDEDGEETGHIVINAKMKASGVSKKDGKPWARTPKVFDSKGKKMSPVPFIFGGSELKVAVQAKAYYMAKDNEAGVAFYLEAVQVIKLVKGGDRDAKGYGFGEEEGYSSDDDAPAEKFDDSTEGDTTTGDAPAAGGNQDF